MPINTNFQAQTVNVVCQTLYPVRESCDIGLLAAICISRISLPAVIEVDVDVACISKAGINNDFGSLFDKTLVDIGFEGIPRVPSWYFE